MSTPQEQYDDAMFDFSRAEFDTAIAKLRALLASHPDHFDAQLALGMAFYRKGDYAVAIAEGHKAEQLRPNEQLVHTNLSLFYMKAGDKVKAEHHGLQARIAGWRENMSSPTAGAGAPADPELQFAAPKPTSTVVSAQKLPDMPWKKKPASAPAPAPQTSPAPSPQPSPPVGEKESAPNQADNTPADPPPSNS